MNTPQRHINVMRRGIWYPPSSSVDSHTHTQVNLAGPSFTASTVVIIPSNNGWSSRTIFIASAFPAILKIIEVSQLVVCFWPFNPRPPSRFVSHRASKKNPSPHPRTSEVKTSVIKDRTAVLRTLPLNDLQLLERLNTPWGEDQGILKPSLYLG